VASITLRALGAEGDVAVSMSRDDLHDPEGGLFLHAGDQEHEQERNDAADDDVH
jgi:rhamnogalacturonyl hydrolase YesR